MPPTLAPAHAPALDAARVATLYLAVIEDLRKQGRPRAALAHLDIFDQQHPRDPRAGLLRARCLADLGDDRSAEALYRKVSEGALAAEADAGIGEVRADRGDWAGAVAAFEAAVGRRPTEVDYLNNLGFALVRGGRTDEGIFRLKQALELAPDDVLVRNNLIVALNQTGRRDEAVRLVREIKIPQQQAAADALLAAGQTSKTGDASP